MPKYLVHFATPALYLPDHPKARLITELPVHAPTPAAATAHALRTTTGCYEITTVEEVAAFARPLPSIEIPPDPPPLRFAQEG